MKKTLMSIIALFLLFIISAAIAESSQTSEFSFHNGIQFNMTENEVRDIEEANGFKWETDSVTGPRARGNILGIDNAIIRFYFDSFYETSPKRAQPEGIDEGNLLACRYVFNTGCFNQVYEAMSKKYGPATYGEDNSPTLSDIWKYDSNYSIKHTSSWSKSVYGKPNKNIRQWLIPYGDSCILIDLYDTYGELFGMGSYDTEMNYFVLTVSEYEAIQSATERYNNDI